MAERINGLDEAAELVADGSLVAIGGAHRMEPVALTKALIRRGVRDLHVVTGPTGGFSVELLAAGNALAVVETAQVSLGELGLAPAFRQGVEEGLIKTVDAS